VNEPEEAIELATPRQERIFARCVGIVSTVGISLPLALALPLALEFFDYLSRSRYLDQLDALNWIGQALAVYSLALSVPWVAIGTVLVIIRWRDLPQRFWIAYLINALLACISLQTHFDYLGI
jgi:hypothetical protein